MAAVKAEAVSVKAMMTRRYFLRIVLERVWEGVDWCAVGVLALGSC